MGRARLGKADTDGLGQAVRVQARQGADWCGNAVVACTGVVWPRKASPGSAGRGRLGVAG
jgi:hypothetical protein